jgi:cytochrome b6-f complex iron-sulfur subunit
MNNSDRSSQSPKSSRRNFLGLALIGSLAVLLSQSLAAILKFLKPVSTGGFGGEIFAGRVEEFAIDSVNRVLKGRFYLVRRDDGFLALWQKCTHLGCSVPWLEEEGHFHCPCHGSVFNQSGEVLGGPAPRPMDLFPISIRSGEVWVDTGKPIQRSTFEDDQVTGA